MDYRKRIADLSKTKGYKWLSVFEIGVNDRLVNRVTEIWDKSSPYDAYLVERNLSEVGRHLENMIAYRNQILTFEESSVRAALDFELFKQNADRLQRLDVAEWHAGQSKLESDEQKTASQFFAGVDSGVEPLAKGFSSVSAAAARVASQRNTDELKRIADVKAKWITIREYQNEIEARFNMPGHVMNLPDRAAKLQTLLLDEVEVAFQKSKTIASAVAVLFDMTGYSVELPRPAAGTDYLNEWLLWHKGLSRGIAIASQKEVESEVSIGFTQTTSYGSQPMKDADFIAKLNGDLLLELDTTILFTDSFQYLKLKGVGISFGAEKAALNDDPSYKYVYCKAIVFPPTVEDLVFKDKNRLLRREPMIFDKVSLTDPNTKNGGFFRGANIENIDPRGLWKIKIPNFIGWTGHSMRKVSEMMTDLRLHFLVQSRPKNTPADWASW
jgi:hypothetical protein